MTEPRKKATKKTSVPKNLVTQEQMQTEMQKLLADHQLIKARLATLKASLDRAEAENIACPHCNIQAPSSHVSTCPQKHL